MRGQDVQAPNRDYTYKTPVTYQNQDCKTHEIWQNFKSHMIFEGPFAAPNFGEKCQVSGIQ